MESYKAHMQEALQADGLTEIVYLAIWRDPQTGVPDVLWQVSNGLETVRGWWRAGESLDDIQWQHETLTGWPTSVALPEETTP
jgi:hypothetical protein